VIRTQISLTEEQHEALRHLASRRARSMSALIRDAVDSLLVREGGDRRSARARFKAAAGSAAGPADLAERHDDYLGPP
jgi:Arc/MetJ-type ribon-helix-helix transcriptional regulator